MADSFSHKEQLKAFMNAAQYFAGITSGQDIWEEAGRVLIRFFGADFAAFGRCKPDGEIEIGNRTFSRNGASAGISEPELIAASGDVFESGFLTFIAKPTDGQMSTAFFPILHENHVIAVMLVGHMSVSHLTKENLDLYLAVAGLFGATYSRHISAQAVLQSKEDWERTFEAVPDMVAILDLEHGIVRANKAMAAKLGVTPEECTGLRCYRAVHGADQSPSYCPYSQFLADGRERSLEIHEDHLCGDFFIRVSPLHDKDGRLLGAVHVVQDITERKRSEDEIRRLNAELEQRVVERTAKLEAANQELEAFAYSVSHDLRAPLRAIDGFSRILKEDHADRLDDEGNRVLSVIGGNIQRMGQLIDDLLSFSRISRREMRCTGVSMEALAQEVFEELNNAEKARIFRFTLSSIPPAGGDPALIRQVFQNLLANAVKYTRSREIAEIEVGCRQEGEEYIYFVRDNGVGFDMKYAEKLFGVFQRLHAMDEYEGTGVGLAIVQRIIQRHGGRVWGEGKKGEGACFHFTLPLRNAIDADHGEQAVNTLK